MTRWLVIAVSCLAALALGGVATAAVSGSGTITGTGEGHTLTVKNTGTDPIKCIRWFAPAGTTVSSATGAGTTAPLPRPASARRA